MNIVEAFETLRRHGHVIDQYSFDKEWLGRKPGYFAYLKSTNRQPSVQTLMCFQLNLMAREKLDARWKIDTGTLSALINLTTEQIEARCRANPPVNQFPLRQIAD